MKNIKLNLKKIYSKLILILIICMPFGLLILCILTYLQFKNNKLKGYINQNMLNIFKNKKKRYKLKQPQYYFTDQYSGKQLANMKKEKFNEVGPFEKRSCKECEYLISNISLWCSNEEAKKYRKISIPGMIKCPFWKPNWKEIDKK